MKHYEVFTPEILMYYATETEPPEYGRCWVSVLAQNKREAKKMAIKDKAFRRWMEDCRSDCKNPFAGLKAELTIQNGQCWVCNIHSNSEPMCELTLKQVFGEKDG